MNTYNVIPREVKLIGTVRTYRKEAQTMVIEKLNQIVEHTCAAFGSVGKVNFIQRRFL